MKILTLNCHSWQEEKQIEKIKYLAKIISEKGYDIIALQEVSQSIEAAYIHSETTLKEDNFLVILISELRKLRCNDYDFYWSYGKVGYDTFEEGLGILTKYKILENKSEYMSISNDIKNWKSRKVIKTKVDYNGKEISICSCHLGWWVDKEEPFKNQVDNLINFTKNEDCIILGDFNNDANIRNEGYDYLKDKGLIDTYEIAKSKDLGLTVGGKIDGWNDELEKRLDIIFTNFKVNVESSNVVFNGKNKDIISDHYGVQVELEI
ncbi:MAG: endonuclease/exonuclease/phosphatase family protein [Sarcina sp.]